MKRRNFIKSSAICLYLVLVCVTSCDKNKATPQEAYAVGWRDGFIQALEKQNWTKKEWREQAKKDSIVFFNAHQR
jgi:hypothetical protein